MVDRRSQAEVVIHVQKGARSHFAVHQLHTNSYQILKQLTRQARTWNERSCHDVNDDQYRYTVPTLFSSSSTFSNTALAARARPLNMASNVAPFHRLLSFYSNRNPHDSQTIRFRDSLRGNLALGLDFPVAFGVAVGRHLFLRNVSIFSLNIHVPSVGWKTSPIDGLEVDEKRDYTRSELWTKTREEKGILAAFDAFGVWSLAADVKNGLISGADIVAFQRGTLLHEVEKRRKNREQVLPLSRGGPISVVGHSWFVRKLFGVEVYKEKED